MAVVIEKKRKKTSLSKSVKKEVLPFEERIVKLRLKKSKEKSFLLFDEQTK